MWKIITGGRRAGAFMQNCYERRFQPLIYKSGADRRSILSPVSTVSISSQHIPPLITPNGFVIFVSPSCIPSPLDLKAGNCWTTPRLRTHT